MKKALCPLIALILSTGAAHADEFKLKASKVQEGYNPVAFRQMAKSYGFYRKYDALKPIDVTGARARLGGYLTLVHVQGNINENVAVAVEANSGVATDAFNPAAIQIRAEMRVKF